MNNPGGDMCFQTATGYLFVFNLRHHFIPVQIEGGIFSGVSKQLITWGNQNIVKDYFL